MTMAEFVSLVQAFVALVGVVSVVSGVVMSIRSFNYTRQKEADARRIEAAKPFLELRQKVYLEAVKIAGILVNSEGLTAEELETAKRRFRQLYVAELTMVEAPEVASQMVALAKEVDPTLVQLTSAQGAAYYLAQALRDSFITSWEEGLKPVQLGMSE